MGAPYFCNLLSLLALASVFASAVVSSQPLSVRGSHCSPFLTCKDCLAETDCGWCSQPVVFQNGTKGTKCAGFTPGQPNPFECTGTYTTDTCPSDEHKYACDSKNHTCVISKYGLSKDECEKSCAKPGPPGPPSKNKVYKCATANNTCMEVPVGTQGAASLDVCKKTCGVSLYMCNSTTSTCDQSQYGLPKNICELTCTQPTPIPPELEGTWRGLQISPGFAAGEFTLIMESGKYTFTSPSGKSESGTTSTLGGDLIFTQTNSDVQRAIYDLKKGEETDDMTLAVGAVGGTAPSGYSSAKDIYVFFKCLSGKKDCSFSSTLLERKESFAWETLKNVEGKRHIAIDNMVPVYKRQLPELFAEDHCAINMDCESCVKEDLCGWCSTPVKKEDGSIGARCAGFSANGSHSGFTCQGIYSTEECLQGYLCNTSTYTCDLADPGEGVSKDECALQCMPAADTYVCNPSNFTCEKATPGHGTSKLLCEAGCQHVKPSNSTPTSVRGSWRGLQINTKYTKGEVDVQFGASNYTWTGPGSFKMSGTTQTTGPGILNLDIVTGPAALVGKTLMGIFETVDGPATSFISIAFNQGSAPPTSFDTAMAGGLESEYVMAKCTGSGNCKW